MTADGPTGAKGQPQFLGTGAPSTAADLNTIANFAAKLGSRMVDTQAVRGSLTAAEMFEGLLFHETDTGRTFRRTGGAWVPAASVATFTMVAGGVSDAQLISTTSPITAVAAETTDSSFITANTGMALTLKAGLYHIAFLLNVNATVTGRTFADIVTGGTPTILARANAQVGDDSVSVTIPVYVPTDGTVVTCRAFKTSGGLSNLTGRLTIVRVA